MKSVATPHKPESIVVEVVANVMSSDRNTASGFAQYDIMPATKGMTIEIMAIAMRAKFSLRFILKRSIASKDITGVNLVLNV